MDRKERICAKCGAPFVTQVWMVKGEEAGATVCGACRTKAREAEEAQREKEAKLQRQERARELRLENSGLEGMEAMTFSNLQARPEVKELATASDLLQELIPHCFGAVEAVHIVTLLGKCGLGKTHLAVAAGFKALENDYDVRFYRVPALVAALNSALFGDRAEYDELWKMVCHTALLVLDDFGTEKWTENTLAYLDSLIATRHQDCAWLLTIITSNLTLKQMPERIASRLQDRAVSRVFFLSGPDFRLIRPLT